MEPAGMAFLALVGYLLALQGGVAKALPLLGLLADGGSAFAAYGPEGIRGLGANRNAKQSLVNVLPLLAQPLPADAKLSHPDPLIFSKSIALEKIHFRYASELPEVIQVLDLDIHRGERIGLIGSTGSGKSTLVDLLMGLLQPTQGRILVDGEDLHRIGRIPAWRTAIAHVPQSIYLADISIAENIAFGIPREQIDLERVRHAFEQAQIAPFIESSISGYDTFVGDMGIPLSGGQRQRIGIARALYKRAHVLVLDEATAALDNATEQSVMEAVEVLTRDPTIVVIAHELSTVQRCDRIIKLEQGSIMSDAPPHIALATQGSESTND
jgi:ABC-type bacteriocin/lantibiotic exporter with double-glycine peptidase domain